jgi:hypothetical protein
MQKSIIDIFGFPLKSLLSVLIPRKDIIVFGENFIKLGINLIRTIIIKFYNSKFIQNLFYGFFLQEKRIFLCKYLYSYI